MYFNQNTVHKTGINLLQNLVLAKCVLYGSFPKSFKLMQGVNHENKLHIGMINGRYDKNWQKS